MCIIIILAVVECGALWKVIKALAGWAVDTANQRSITARLAGAMFYAAAITSHIVIWRLSCSWQRLSIYWLSVESALNIKQVPRDETLKRKLRTVTIFICFGGTVEHLMNILSSIGLHCAPPDVMRTYILKSHGFLLLELIVITSMYIHKKIVTLQDEEITQLYLWRRVREAYVKQAKLVRVTDDSLGVVVLASCFFNFYFICLHLFLGITRGITGDPLQQIYYLVSLCWISIRATCVMLAAADVNQYSNRAVKYLSNCPPRYYNIEVRRLQEQLLNDRVAISGMGFFYLTNSVLLQVASSVITYVLVLVQYDSSDRNDP
ncbi:gustatory receptor for sugar taste 64b-like [Leptidea sinapis]|uniref:gustatory receptor for sugar taste 64b-like n=1 Tax=Leptidea sinapis TaxID=189913 RepID=UPI0021C3162D|nr:gustatory receptor for sugar taste 64b-like [Leptidea sinapis]